MENPFEIYFSELDEETQKAFLKHFNIKEPLPEWDKCPIALVYGLDIGVLT